MFRILAGPDVRAALSMTEAIPLVVNVFAQLFMGRALVPLPKSFKSQQEMTLFMPTRLSECQRTALKIVSVDSQNRLLGLPSIMAMVALVDGQTGRPSGSWRAHALAPCALGLSQG